MLDKEESLTKVHIDLPNHWAIDGESLWALELGEDLYEIRNTPFHAYAINWGDIVRAPADNEDQIPEVREIVKRSGHDTFRILFNSDLDQEGQDSILLALQSLNLSWERCDDCFVALDVHPGADLYAVHSKLLDLQKEKVLSFETCEARLPGGFDAASSEGN
ncbi:MAG TPA: DUF4265 domain-containing protein [Pyrinomonadaceae bacterium]|nr:DUF4265 domain-containing protein [Pyrinomonadaceae bacterium]